MFTYNLSIFLTSTAFVDTNAKYGIPLLRYTVFLENYPLGYDPKDSSFLNYLNTEIELRTFLTRPETIDGWVMIML